MPFSIKCVLSLDRAGLFWTVYFEHLYNFRSNHGDTITLLELLILRFQPIYEIVFHNQ
jgi:hypothetical protein